MNNKPKPNKVTVEAFQLEEKNYIIPPGFEIKGHAVINLKGNRSKVYIIAENKEWQTVHVFVFNSISYQNLYDRELA
jgi:hypothetical protein